MIKTKILTGSDIVDFGTSSIEHYSLRDAYANVPGGEQLWNKSGRSYNGYFINPNPDRTRIGEWGTAGTRTMSYLDTGDTDVSIEMTWAGTVDWGISPIVQINPDSPALGLGYWFEPLLFGLGILWNIGQYTNNIQAKGQYSHQTGGYVYPGGGPTDRQPQKIRMDVVNGWVNCHYFGRLMLSFPVLDDCRDSTLHGVSTDINGDNARHVDGWDPALTVVQNEAAAALRTPNTGPEDYRRPNKETGLVTDLKVRSIPNSVKPCFRADLTHTLEPWFTTKGSKTATFTRSTLASVVDFEGNVRYAKPNEPRFSGARRIENVLVGATDTQSTLAASTSVFPGQVYRFSFSGDGTCLVDGVTIEGSSEYRSTSGVISSVGSIAHSVTSGTCFDFMLEQVSGQRNQNPSEYVSKGVLSAPYHGAGIDGVMYSDKYNPHWVDGTLVKTPSMSMPGSCGGGGPIYPNVEENRINQQTTIGTDSRYLSTADFQNSITYGDDPTETDGLTNFQGGTNSRAMFFVDAKVGETYAIHARFKRKFDSDRRNLRFVANLGQQVVSPNFSVRRVDIPNYAGFEADSGTGAYETHFAILTMDSNCDGYIGIGNASSQVHSLHILDIHIQKMNSVDDQIGFRNHAASSPMTVTANTGINGVWSYIYPNGGFSGSQMQRGTIPAELDGDQWGFTADADATSGLLKLSGPSLHNGYPSNPVVKGYLSEEAGSNMLSSPETVKDTGNGDWNVALGASVTGNAFQSPDTTTTGFETSFGANNLAGFYQELTLTNEPHTFSVWAKCSSTQISKKIALSYQNVSNSDTFPSEDFEVYGEWVRLEYTFVPSAGTGRVIIKNENGDDGTILQTVPSGSVVFWGAQLEVSPHATSYVHSIFMSGGRTSDLLTYEGAQNISENVGYITTKSQSMWGTASEDRYLVSREGGAHLLYAEQGDDADTIRSEDGAGSIISNQHTSMQNFDVPSRVSWKYRLKLDHDLSFLWKPTEVYSDTISKLYDGSQNTGKIIIGAKADGTGQWNGNIRRVEIFDVEYREIINSQERSLEQVFPYASIYESSEVFHSVGNGVLSDEVDISGEWAIVGGTETAQSNNSGPIGEPRVFREVNGVWQNFGTITPSVTTCLTTGDDLWTFGRGVAIDGDWMAISTLQTVLSVTAPGDPDTSDDLGAVFMFKWTGSAWVEQQIIDGSDLQDLTDFDDPSGLYWSVGARLSIDGDQMVLHAGQENILVYELSNGVWSGAQKIQTPAGRIFQSRDFGIVIDGDWIARCSQTGTGVNTIEDVAVWKKTSGTWNFHSSVKPNNPQLLYSVGGIKGDNWGVSIDIRDGYLLIGAGDRGDNYEGAAELFEYDGVSDEWLHLQTFMPSLLNEALSGESVALGPAGIVFIGCSNYGDYAGGNPETGFVAVYRKQAEYGVWTRDANISSESALDVSITDGAGFGTAVAVSGDYVIVGAPYEGANAEGAIGIHTYNLF
jgi:hypothetical protein